MKKKKGLSKSGNDSNSSIIKATIVHRLKISKDDAHQIQYIFCDNVFTPSTLL